MDNRFGFGDNWQAFEKTIDESRVLAAQREMSRFLGDDLSGRSFLDIGSGSGIHSLAARRLKASRILSFDFDIKSVECTQTVKTRFAENDDSWQVMQGSILDDAFVSDIGEFDVVYSWGVLHHTGAMWQAIENAMRLVKPHGSFLVAIYNDQGWKSSFWWYIKFVYNRLPSGVNRLYAVALGYFFLLANIAKYGLQLRLMEAIRPLLERRRGMSMYHDMIDWIGGFPFEVATYERLETFFQDQGFELVTGERASSLACHQMVFRKH